MNQEQLEGKFDQLKGKVKQTWGKLTDDDFAKLKGNRDEFLGIIKEKHGVAREEADKSLKQMEESCGCASKDSRAA